MRQRSNPPRRTDFFIAAVELFVDKYVSLDKVAEELDKLAAQGLLDEVDNDFDTMKRFYLSDRLKESQQIYALIQAHRASK